MSVALKEKVKRYLKENYGRYSIREVSERFDVSQAEIEEYIIDELPQEKKQEKKPDNHCQEKKEGMLWLKRILMLLILLAIFILVVSLTISPLSNNDIWQHLKNGQMILRTRQFQYADPYSCNAAGHPWINEAWFSGVIFYSIYLLMGVNGIIYLNSFVTLLMAALVLYNCYKLDTKYIVFVILTVFMIFNVGVRFLARTEMYSYMFVAAFFLILMQYKYKRIDRRYLYLLPVLQIFWSNMHGSFIVGVFIVVIFTGCETIRLIFNRYVSFWQKDLLTLNRLKPLYIISIFTFLACLINPYGVKLLSQPFEVVFQHSEYIKTIYEWQSPFESDTFKTSYAFIYYIVWMILLGISFLIDIKRIDLSNLIFSAFFFIMAYKMHRNITIFTIATCPIIALNLQQAGNDFLTISGQKLKELIDTGGGVLIIGVLIPLILISFKHGYIYRKNSSKGFGLGVAPNMPIRSTEYIKKNHIKGCCFNSYTYGTYLIFHCFPDTRVTMDSRAEHVYGENFYRRHQMALYDVNVFTGILSEFNIEYILLKFESENLARHCKYLQESGQWALVYFDESCFLYVKRLPEYADLIARDEYKYIHPLLTMEQTAIPKDQLDGYIRESERNLSLNPNYFFPHILLLNLYSARGEWAKVIPHGEFLIAQNQKNFTVYMLLGMSYSNVKESIKAKEMFNIALSLKPDSEEARRALSQLSDAKNSELLP